MQEDFILLLFYGSLNSDIIIHVINNILFRIFELN